MHNFKYMSDFALRICCIIEVIGFIRRLEAEPTHGRRVVMHLINAAVLIYLDNMYMSPAVDCASNHSM